MKITEIITKSLPQDHGPCYSHLPIFSYTCTGKQEVAVIAVFNKKLDHRPLFNYVTILQAYSSVRIGFNMNNKCHTLPAVCTMLV